MMAKNKTGTREEWLAARLKLLKAEKIGTKQGAFFSADSAAPTNKRSVIVSAITLYPLSRAIAGESRHLPANRGCARRRGLHAACRCRSRHRPGQSNIQQLRVGVALAQPASHSRHTRHNLHHTRMNCKRHTY